MKYVPSAFFVLLVAMLPMNNVFAQQATRPMPIFAIGEQDTPQFRGPEIFDQADLENIKKFIPENGAPFDLRSFALNADGDWILFDAALGGETWVKNLNNTVKAEEVKLVLISHLHGDHIGGLLNGDNRRFPNAKILCAVPEYDYWLPKDDKPRTPQLEKIKAAYGQDFATFKFDDEVFANANFKVKALDASGHTPGHTVFLIEGTSAANRVRELIIGDLLHMAAVQFPLPDITSRFDMDKEKTVAARKRILDFAVVERIPIRGIHLPTGRVGMVEKNDQGGYIFLYPQPRVGR